MIMRNGLSNCAWCAAWTFMVLLVTTTAARGDVYISEYYEGVSNDKWIEIYNSGTDAINLATGDYRLGVWSNSPANVNWKTGTAASGSFSLSGTIAAGGVMIYANSSAALPFSQARGNLSNSTINFNGDDTVAVFTPAPYAFGNVRDAFGMTATGTSGSPGTNQAWSRKTTVTTGTNTDFDSNSWDSFTNTLVDSAAITTNERIGIYKRGGITVVWDGNSNTAGTGGTQVWDGSSTFFRSKPNESLTLAEYYIWNDTGVNSNARDNLLFSGTAGTVTMTLDRTVGGLMFSTNGYAVAGATRSMTFDGTGNIDTIGAALTATIGAKIATTSGVSVNKIGVGTLILTNDNTYTSATNINAGTLAISGSGALSDSTAVTVSAAAAFDISAATSGDTVGSIAGGGSILLGSKNLTAGGDNTSTAHSGTMTGTGGSFTKSGTGVLALSGPNSYTGTTTVNSGTLRVNGTHTGGGVYTVKNTATLGGIGSIGSGVTVEAGGKLSPGNSIGDITVSTLSLDANAIFDVEVKTTPTESSDRTLVTGASGTTVTLGSGGDFPILQFTFTPAEIATFSPGKAFVIIQNENAGTITGKFKGTAGASTVQNGNNTTSVSDGLLQYVVYYGNYAGAGLVFGNNSGGNDVVAEFNAVPEPSSAIILGAVGLGLAARRRRSM
mgnify:CR=1 FL=1